MSQPNSLDIQCPALFIAGIASGQGKTTITAAIARYHKNKGRKVIVFKTGPDYLDPKILALASGNPVEQLDLWMAGKEYCSQQIYLAAKEADLILIEGAMGLLDGEPSSVDLAKAFGFPVAVVINARGMAQTIQVIAQGLVQVAKETAKNFKLAGLICNALGSQRHIELIEQSIPDNINLLACLKREQSVQLPERHLGLVEPETHRSDETLDKIIDAAALWIADTQLTDLPEAITFYPSLASKEQSSKSRPLKDKTIGIAKDKAFSFIYAVNVRCLIEMGADIQYFSPLKDKEIPNVDAIWLPGGYPELHTQQLSNNTSMKESLQNFVHSGRPLLAECGGMLAIQETLTDMEGQAFPVFNLIPGHGELRDRPGCQGMQTAPLPEGDVRAHAHHRSRSHDTLTPIAYGKRQRHSAPGEPIIRDKNITASYLHLFFPSNPDAIAQLFNTRIAVEIAIINSPVEELN